MTTVIAVQKVVDFVLEDKEEECEYLWNEFLESARSGNECTFHKMWILAQTQDRSLIAEHVTSAKMFEFIIGTGIEINVIRCYQFARIKKLEEICRLLEKNFEIPIGLQQSILIMIDNITLVHVQQVENRYISGMFKNYEKISWVFLKGFDCPLAIEYPELNFKSDKLVQNNFYFIPIDAFWQVSEFFVNLPTKYNYPEKSKYYVPDPYLVLKISLFLIERGDKNYGVKMTMDGLNWHIISKKYPQIGEI